MEDQYPEPGDTHHGPYFHQPPASSRPMRLGEAAIATTMSEDDLPESDSSQLSSMEGLESEPQDGIPSSETSSWQQRLRGKISSKEPHGPDEERSEKGHGINLVPFAQEYLQGQKSAWDSCYGHDQERMKPQAQILAHSHAPAQAQSRTYSHTLAQGHIQIQSLPRHHARAQTQAHIQLQLQPQLQAHSGVQAQTQGGIMRDLTIVQTTELETTPLVIPVNPIGEQKRQRSPDSPIEITRVRKVRRTTQESPPPKIMGIRKVKQERLPQISKIDINTNSAQNETAKTNFLPARDVSWPKMNLSFGNHALGSPGETIQSLPASRRSITKSASDPRGTMQMHAYQSSNHSFDSKTPRSTKILQSPSPAFKGAETSEAAPNIFYTQLANELENSVTMAQRGKVWRPGNWSKSDYSVLVNFCIRRFPYHEYQLIQGKDRNETEHVLHAIVARPLLDALNHPSAQSRGGHGEALVMGMQDHLDRAKHGTAEEQSKRELELSQRLIRNVESIIKEGGCKQCGDKAEKNSRLKKPKSIEEAQAALATALSDMNKSKRAADRLATREAKKNEKKDTLSTKKEALQADTRASEGRKTGGKKAKIDGA